MIIKAQTVSIYYQSYIQIRRTFVSKTLQKQPYLDIMPWEWTSLNSMRPFRKYRQNTYETTNIFLWTLNIEFSTRKISLRENEIVIRYYTWGNMIVLETELYFECTLEIQTLFHSLKLETYQSDTISLVRFLLHMLQILGMKQTLRG